MVALITFLNQHIFFIYTKSTILSSMTRNSARPFTVKHITPLARFIFCLLVVTLNLSTDGPNKQMYAALAISPCLVIDTSYDMSTNLIDKHDVRQVCSAFCVVRETSAKFDLREGNVKLNTNNEE
jgi:hypothetical protein